MRSDRVASAGSSGRLLGLGLISVLVGLLTFSSFYSTSALGAQNRSSSWRSAAVAAPQLSSSTSVAKENDDLKREIARLQMELDKRHAGAMQEAAAAVAATPAAAAVAGAAGASGSAGANGGASGSSSAASTTRQGLYEVCDTVAPYNASIDSYRLTCKLIRSRVDANNIILVTFVNSKRADYGFTWAGHVQRLGLSNYLVGAMDGEALTKLNARAIPTFDMASGLTTADYGWGTKNFRKLGLRKTELIISLLRAKADPILTDADALITRDPSPFVLRFLPEAQILVTSDYLMDTTKGDHNVLEVPERASSSAWNIGYFYLHHSTLASMLHWQRECIDHPTLWDQNLFKDVLKIGGLKFRDVPAPIKNKRLFLGYNQTIAIGILPISTFCSGHSYFVQRMPQRYNVEPYSVHTTFQYSGAVGKTHRLREAMLWEEEQPSSYYNPGQGLLVYVPTIRYDLIRPSGKMDVDSHFTLMNHQLLQLRTAFLLAGRLGRLLVLPKIVCGLDRFWAPHNGTIPGSDTRLPVDPCPADHLLDLEAMARRKPLETRLREHSFLSNPRMPAAVLASKAEVSPPGSLTEEGLQSLRAMGATKVLKLSSMPDLFPTLPRDIQQEEQMLMRQWTSLWCCSVPPPPAKAGHVHYDMFFDMVPHEDKHRRTWNEPWKVKFGP